MPCQSSGKFSFAWSTCDLENQTSTLSVCDYKFLLPSSRVLQCIVKIYWFGKSFCHLLKSICRRWTKDMSRQDWNKLILKYELIFTEKHSVAWLKQNRRSNHACGFSDVLCPSIRLGSPAHCHMLPVWNQTQLQSQTHSNTEKTSEGK